MSEKPNYKIIANNKEEFEYVEKQILSLPSVLQHQISTAEKNPFGNIIHCICKRNDWSETTRVFLADQMISIYKAKHGGFRAQMEGWVFNWGEEFDQLNVEFQFLKSK